MTKEIIITSYHEPDLDAISSMYAYTEYLTKKSIVCDYLIHGKPKKEVDIVCELFNIKLNGKNNLNDNQEIIILDTNSPYEINFVNPKSVIEIIDHHKKIATSIDFPKAKIQVEELGAVATIIAEKFKKDNLSISRESAILLYYGIISNSINLKASITSPRDIEITNWLEKQCKEIDKEKIKIIFERKSKIEDKNLRKEMEAEVTFYYEEKPITVAQLEITNVEKFVTNKKDKIIKILEEIKKEKQLDYIFINCVDILNGYTIILTIDKKTEKLLKQKFNFNFENGIYKTNKIIQRKELLKILRSS